jgi:hypothetical protein
MVLLAVVNDLFPHGVSVMFGKVDPVIRQREVSGKISGFVFEYFLFRLESGDVAVCSLESTEYIRAEAKFRDGVVRVGSQESRDIFVPLIISDPAEVG